MTMTMTTDSIAVILACPAPRLDWRSKIPWPQREPVALSKWTEVRNAKTTSAKKVPNIQEPAPQTASSTHFQVFRCFPDMSNLHQSSAFPNLQVLSSAPPPHRWDHLHRVLQHLRGEALHRYRPRGREEQRLP